MKIDPRSDRIALHYTGNDAGEPAISGVPARDLTENDVDRLVRVEHGELRGAARSGAIDKLLEGLMAGPYRRTAPPKPADRKRPSKPAITKPATTVPRETSTVTTTSTAPVTPPAEPSATTPKEA